MNILVVRLQNSWNKVVEARYSYFPIIEESETEYKINLTKPNPHVVHCSDIIKKDSINVVSYTEMYTKTNAGRYWGFDVQIAVLAEREDRTIAFKLRKLLCETAMEELKLKNKEIKEVYYEVEELA